MIGGEGASSAVDYLERNDEHIRPRIFITSARSHLVNVRLSHLLQLTAGSGGCLVKPSLIRQTGRRRKAAERNNSECPRES